ncbi:MAG: 3',5'-cyclic-AMP phosphodiesterase [Gammaproteobacteria bacterium]
MNQATTLSILQISDLHIMPNAGEKMLGIDTEFYFHSVMQHAHSRRERYDLILVSGDLTQEPCASSYQRIRDRLEAYRTECICLPGNHDDGMLMRKIMTSGNISCNKQRLFDHWQLLCLNSQIPGQPGGHIDDNELEFLEAKLAGRPDRFALVAVHHHFLPTGSEWLDTMIIDNSPKLLDTLRRYPQIRAVTTGHIHQEMDITIDSFRVLATPSTCFQFKPDSRDFTLDASMPGYRIIELFPDGRIFTQAQRLPGKLADLDAQSPGY